MLLQKLVKSIVSPAVVAVSLLTTSDVSMLEDVHSRLTPESPSNIVNVQPTAVDNDGLPSTKHSNSPTEDYLPRRLYPGTYQNYCGPTPETDYRNGCVAHGWHGDTAKDVVDAACQLHDVSYCRCESELMQRRGGSSISMLSSMTALRFVTRPAMSGVVDPEYFQCINKADRELITTGLEIRGRQQRSACSAESGLEWFCRGSNTGIPTVAGAKDTLKAFEKVSLEIFLKSLDSDRGSTGEGGSVSSSLLSTRLSAIQGGQRSSPYKSLSSLEKQRTLDMEKELRRGKSLSEAASSPTVINDEQAMLRRLSANDNDVVRLAKE